LGVLVAFLECDNPSVTILHPWRQFEKKRYEEVQWEVHMVKFVADLRTWLDRFEGADAERFGKWNRKPNTVGGHTKRLVDHEVHHISALRQ